MPDAQLRACFVALWTGTGGSLSGRLGFLPVRAVATAFAENSLAELESYEKTLELVFPLAVDAPQGAQLSPECWLSTENIQCSCTGGTLEVTVTARAEGSHPLPQHLSGHWRRGVGRAADRARPGDRTAHLLRAGREELFGIAKRFHVSPAQMLTANGFGSRYAGPAAGDAFSGAGRINRRRTLPFQAAFSLFCAEKKVKKPFLLCVRESIIKSGV